MPGMRLKPSIISYNSLINGYYKKGRVEEAGHLFLEVPHKGQIIEAFSFLHIMEEQGVYPDITTYSTLIHGLCKNGKLEIARDLSNSLPCKSLQPDVQLYAIIIGSLCQEGHVEETKCLLAEMEKSGCAPNTVTYNICIQGLLERKLLAEAKALLDEMHRRGFSPDSTTVSLFINQPQDEGYDDCLRKLAITSISSVSTVSASLKALFSGFRHH
ncbi:UNVERIFIED_CONTAM: hypothetical protein Sangu_2908900 [Sesamum angustifolium]|uniref:Pentatricopeptide repeat-containing protein n=1 Tax=Sesamum angustifolium TaxID=2727405 RepID=A0AAW2ILE4_9LAMI